DRLNREINAALGDPGIKARLIGLGGTLLPQSPAEFGKLIADETEKWGKVVRFAGIKREWFGVSGYSIVSETRIHPLQTQVRAGRASTAHYSIFKPCALMTVAQLA